MQSMQKKFNSSSDIPNSRCYPYKGSKGYSNMSNASAGNMTKHDHSLARAMVPNAI